MTMDTATSLVLLGTGALWLAWELVLVWGRARGSPWATISIVLKDAALRFCVLPAGLGVLTGHWFAVWPRSSNPWFAGWPLWVALLAVAALADLAVWRWAPAREVWPGWLHVLRYPGIWLLLGVAAGALGWPQRATL